MGDHEKDEPEAGAAHELARRQFAVTAGAYVDSPIHAQGDDLGEMVREAGALEGRRVLDVATGAGHTALAFARAGAEVTATDLTPEMLETARGFLARFSEARRIRLARAAAESLPFEGGSFDVVTCRIAAHHFSDPEAFVRESARVLRSGGKLIVVDNIAPADDELASAMNRIERLRDPSHVEGYRVARWVEWFDRAGLDLLTLKRWHRQKDYREWLERGATPTDAVRTLEAELLAFPRRVQEYLELRLEQGRPRQLAHEAALLVALLR